MSTYLFIAIISYLIGATSFLIFISNSEKDQPSDILMILNWLKGFVGGNLFIIIDYKSWTVAVIFLWIGHILSPYKQTFKRHEFTDTPVFLGAISSMSLYVSLIFFIIKFINSILSMIISLPSLYINLASLIVSCLSVSLFDNISDYCIMSLVIASVACAMLESYFSSNNVINKILQEKTSLQKNPYAKKMMQVEIAKSIRNI